MSADLQTMALLCDEEGEAAVRVVVHPDAPLPQAGTAEETFSAVLRPGTPMSEVGAAVRRCPVRRSLDEVLCIPRY